jgi:hypothetical protein
MIKRRYDVMLEQDVVSDLKVWLEPKKISFSAYLNALIKADLKEIKDGGKEVRERFPVATISSVVTQLLSRVVRENEKLKKVKKK